MKTNYLDLQLKFMAFCENNNIDKAKYFISYSDKRCGNLAAIMEYTENGGRSLAGGGSFCSFAELIAWMDGYTAAKKLILFE